MKKTLLPFQHLLEQFRLIQKCLVRTCLLNFKMRFDVCSEPKEKGIGNSIKYNTSKFEMWDFAMALSFLCLLLALSE